MYQVVTAHTPKAPGPEGPLRVRAGGRLELNGKTDDWHGHTWLWAEDSEARAGWVPDDLTGAKPGDKGQFKAMRDYSAAELTCQISDRLIGLFASHGWVWCAHPNGRAGWVPLRCLSPIPGNR